TRSELSGNPYRRGSPVARSDTARIALARRKNPCGNQDRRKRRPKRTGENSPRTTPLNGKTIPAGSPSRSSGGTSASSSGTRCNPTSCRRTPTGNTFRKTTCRKPPERPLGSAFVDGVQPGAGSVLDRELPAFLFVIEGLKDDGFDVFRGLEFLESDADRFG